MGVDLTLIPVEAEWPMTDDEGEHTSGYGHTLLELRGDSGLWPFIRALKKAGMPKDFTSWVCQDEENEEPHYGRIREDSYGHPLRAVYAFSLAGVIQKRGHPASTRNVAVAAYLAALEPDTKIVLFWH